MYYLLKLRLNKDSAFTRQKPMIKFSNSSGLKENNAVKIDEPKVKCNLPEIQLYKAKRKMKQDDI